MEFNSNESKIRPEIECAIMNKCRAIDWLIEMKTFR